MNQTARQTARAGSSDGLTVELDQPTATVAEPSLLDLIAEAGVATREGRRVEAVQTVEVAVIAEYEWQLLEWYEVLSPCPGCDHYPCLPGVVKGHRRHVYCRGGEIVKIR